MGQVLKFLTPDGGLRKKTQKNFSVFCKITQFQDPFQLNFSLENLFKAAQNAHKISVKRTGEHKLNYQTSF